MPTIDRDALVELEGFLLNEGKLYPQRKQITEALKRKIKAGKYSAALAPKAWAHWVESGAKEYCRQFARAADWSKIFPKPTRDALAKQLAVYFHGQITRGEI